MSNTVTEQPVWRQLLARAYHLDDDTWHMGEGGDFLLDLLIELMHPQGDDAPPALTSEQLQHALDHTTDRD